MTTLLVLAIIAVAQTVFLVLIAILLVFNRSRQAARLRARAAAAAQLAKPVQQWLVGERPVADVAAVLATLPPRDALAQVVLMATQLVPASQLPALAQAIEGAPWVARVMKQSRSRRWWKRLEAARLLSVVGGPRDRERLLAFLDDPHAAVQGVATAALPRVGDLDAVARVLEGLPARPPVIRLFQFSMLKESWWLTTPALLDRLTSDADPVALETWVALAEAIGSADLLSRVVTLAAHPRAEVRIAVARALGRYFHADAPRALLVMLSDVDWRVRAQAARALGTVGGPDVVPQLRDAMNDAQWWVRFRAGLALAQLGERGRAALREARGGSDAATADMARMVSGLSQGSLVELSQG